MLNRGQLERYISEQYGSAPEHPWMKSPDNTVFRHYGNQKWFALMMRIPRSRLGLSGQEMLDVLNIKCDPLLIGSLLEEKGFFPAYHMSKAKWITVALDGSVADEKIKWLLDMSFEATGPKKKTK